MTSFSFRRAVAALLCASLAGIVRADVILDWNTRAETLAAAERTHAPETARMMALLNVSMFEAINAIERRYEPFGLDLVADRNTSREAAAASAAHTVLTALFEDHRAAIDAYLAADLGLVALGPARDRGILVGRKAGGDLLELHASDGKGVDDYRPFTHAGKYVPTQPVVGVLLRTFKPWVMDSAAMFRPAAPPALTSDAWARDVNEIREVGALNSAIRSDEQTTVAKFWFITGARTYNPIVRQVVLAQKLDLLDCARVHALASMAAADAFIAVFDAKYHYNFWRPITAIRNADLSGNPATPRDPVWQPLGDTPMHPEYPCAHCISASAVATVLRMLVGNEAGDISLTSLSAPGVTRHWARLSDYADEVSNARIWAGFHYRFSTEVGKEMGRRIGELTVATKLRPVSVRRRER